MVLIDDAKIYFIFALECLLKFEVYRNDANEITGQNS